jgi:hypothetical protein
MGIGGCRVIGLGALVLLAGCGGGGGGRDDAGSHDDAASSGGGAHCMLDSLGVCACDDTRVYDGGLAQCTEASVGGHGICCQGSGRCTCRPISCGISTATGDCTCGSLLPAFSGGRTSCTATASTCCTQDTHYCYCEDGCEARFGNRIVSSCDLTTDTVMCGSGETQVASCD